MSSAEEEASTSRPSWHKASGNAISEEFEPVTYFQDENIAELVKASGGYEMLPDNGKSEDELAKRIKSFIGLDMTDEQYSKLVDYCDPDNLENYEHPIAFNAESKEFPFIRGRRQFFDNTRLDRDPSAAVTNTHKQFITRVMLDTENRYIAQVKKYNFMLPDCHRTFVESVPYYLLTRPGQDLIYRVKIYHQYNKVKLKCNQEIAIFGRQKLTDLRDMIKCPNEIALCIDYSEHPNMKIPTAAKTVFPSGFLFINNTFYEDRRAESYVEYSAVLRQWAKEKRMGEFPVKSMEEVTIQDIPIRLGFPELFMHQGNCEHLFTFSSVRLANANDEERYPLLHRIPANQVMCLLCGNSTSKWVVMNSDRCIFDPGYYCETCFRSYNYIDGKKIDNFKAYKVFGE